MLPYCSVYTHTAYSVRSMFNAWSRAPVQSAHTHTHSQYIRTIDMRFNPIVDEQSRCMCVHIIEQNHRQFFSRVVKWTSTIIQLQLLNSWSAYNSTLNVSCFWNSYQWLYGLKWIIISTLFQHIHENRTVEWKPNQQQRTLLPKLVQYARVHVCSLCGYAHTQSLA